MFRRLTYYKEGYGDYIGKATTKRFLINLNNVETVTSYGDHSKIVMVSGRIFHVCELEMDIIQMA